MATILYMSPKDRFLQSISDKIRSLQAAYESAKNLPEEIFESINNPTNDNPDSNVNGSESTAPVITNIDEESTPAAYGNNRKFVVSIFNKVRKAMRREDVIREIEKINPNIDSDAVTRNTFSALQTRGVIKKYKPEGATFRGAYWTLSTWWKDGELLPEYEPVPYDAVSKYL